MQSLNTPVYVNSPGSSQNIIVNTPNGTTGVLGNYTVNGLIGSPVGILGVGAVDSATVPTTPDGFAGLAMGAFGDPLDITPYASGQNITTSTSVGNTPRTNLPLPIVTNQAFITRDSSGAITATSGLQSVNQTLYPYFYNINGAFINNILQAPMLQFDVPRNVTVVISATTALAGTYTVTWNGIDVYNQFMTETITGVASGTSITLTGNKAALFIFSATVTVTGETDTSAAVILKTGSSIGLPRYCNSTNYVFCVKYDGYVVADFENYITTADSTNPATAITGDVRGTINVNGLAAYNGNTRLTVYQYVPGASTSDIANGGLVSRQGIYGVSQYSALIQNSDN